MQTLPRSTISLWPEGAPGARGFAPEDIPALTPFLPDRTAATGAAFVICPGGGYGALADDHEGRAYAEWMNQHGIAAFVLRYRLGAHGYRHPVMLGDAARALRLVRARAEEWNVDGGKVGVMGSSAGGHLASLLLTHGDAAHPASPDPAERHSARPDLGVLCYPVITMTGEHAHAGSRQNLVGDTPSEALLQTVSSELHVSAQTPPCFLWHTADDTAVPVENSLLFAAALSRSAVPFELHISQNGAHGLGMGDSIAPFTDALPWTHSLRRWLAGWGWTHG